MALHLPHFCHANRRHCNWRQTLALEAPDDDDVTHTSCWLGNFDADDGGPEALGPSHSSNSDDSEEGIDLQRTAALFLLILKEKHRLTQSAVDFAVGSVKQMMTLAYEGSKQSVKEALQSSQDTSDISHAADLDSCFQLAFVDPFSGLETEYLQTKYYRDNFNLVVSNA